MFDPESSQDLIKNKPTTKSYNLTIDGINISFPHEPYKVQVDYIGKLLECLRKKQNGLLESPTGTGKTLSLLCGSLAWLEQHRAYQQLAQLGSEQNSSACFDGGSLSSQLEYQKRLSSQLGNAVGTFASQSTSSFGLAPTKVIYSSRTHSQLSQVIQELKKTNYNHLPSVVLGSRDQLCLLPEVASLENNSAKRHACRVRVKGHTCLYYNNTEQKVASEIDFRKPAVLDIEDLIKLGSKHKCCPYYTAKEMKKKSDVIFAPYNYLIEPKTRKAQGIELQNNVIIFDEAHNIESVCEDGMSFQIKSKDIACSISEVTDLMEKLVNMNKPDAMDYGSPMNMDISIDDLASLKVMLTEIEKILDEALLNSPTDKNVIKKGGYIFEVLGKAGLNRSTAQNVLTVIENIMLNINESQSFGGTKTAGLTKFTDMLEIIFSNINSPAPNRNRISGSLPDFNVDYKICISNDENNYQNGATNKKDKYNYWKEKKVEPINPKRSWLLNCWCLSAERSMHDLINQEIHCMILTSGTLSPLQSFQAELGVPFPVQLENPHIINPEQVLIAIVSKGPDGIMLNSSYANRNNSSYINSLGMTVSNFCTSIPKGVLVFYPSYSVMTGCLDKWKETSIFTGLNNKKTIFVEPRSKDAFVSCMDEYYKNIEDSNSKGALLFGVCRGKVSEGLDFADDHARAVIITGIPFAPFFDERVKQKKQYLTDNKHKGLSGEQWYMLQAIRAVNQAIGRVIRHKSDFGAVLLCDNRFERKDYINQLSKWVRGHVKTYPSFGLVKKSLSDFFKKQKNIVTIPKTVRTNFVSENTYLPVKHLSANSASNFTCIRNEKQVESNEDILEVYSKISGNVEFQRGKKSKRLSVFDAMNLPEEIKKTESPSTIDISSQRSPQVQTNPPALKKRKINVAPVNIFGNSSDVARDKNEEHKKLFLAEKQTNIKKFTAQVKEVYGKERLLSLHASVREAIHQKDVNIFVKELVDLSSIMDNKKEIFKSVILLLPTTMRNEFLQQTKPILQANPSTSSDAFHSTGDLVNEINGASSSHISKSQKVDTFYGKFSDPRGVGAICSRCKIFVNKGKGSVARCLHICCMDCWRIILKTTKACPMCQSKVKSIHVKKTHVFAFSPIYEQNKHFKDL